MADRTIKEIYDIIIAQMESEYNYNIPLLSKAFSRVTAKIFSGIWKINYNFANWIFLQLFVSSASFLEFEVFGKTIIPLIEWGRLVGEEDPTEATAAKIEMLFNVVSIGESLPSGTQFISTVNGEIYITEQSYSLTGSTILIEATCTNAGLIGNLNIGDEISTVNALGIIERSGVVSARTTDGTEAETEESYRTRVSGAFKQRPQGGAYVDYRVWASEVPGVLQTYIYTGDAPTQTLVYVSGITSIYPDRVPTSDLLIAVGEAIDYDTSNGYPIANRRPPGSIIDPVGDKSYTNIKPIGLRSFDVEIENLIANNETEVKSRILSTIESYMLEREPYIVGLSVPPSKNLVEQNALISAVQNIIEGDGGSFDSLLLYETGFPVPKTPLAQGELAELGALTYVTS